MDLGFFPFSFDQINAECLDGMGAAASLYINEYECKYVEPNGLSSVINIHKFSLFIE